MDSTTKGKVASGFKWTSVETAANLGLNFIVGILIARQLTPADYGLIGMLGIFMAISQTFLDSGFSQALIQKQDADNDDFSTTFFLNIGMGVFFYSLLYLCAPLIAQFYNQPLLIPITRVYMLTLVINSLMMVQTTKLSKDMEFRTKSILNLSSSIVSGIFGITMAYTGFGVWALVWCGLGSKIFSCLLLWSIVKWRPLLVFSKKSFNALFGYGSKHLASALINTIYGNIATIIIGKAYQAKDLGLFSRADGFANLPTSTITSIVLRVNFPVLARLQNDNAQLLSTYSTLLRVPLFLLYPILFGMAVLASPLLEVLLGANWLACAGFLVIMCFGRLWSPLTSINLNLLYVKGRTDLVLKLELIKKPIAFVMLFAAIPFGIYGMCVSIALYEFVAFCINCHYTGKLLDYGFRKQMAELLPILGYSALMAVVVWTVTYFFSSPALKLLIGITSGIIVYVALAWISKDPTFGLCKNYLAAKLRLNFKRY